MYCNIYITGYMDKISRDILGQFKNFLNGKKKIGNSYTMVLSFDNPDVAMV